MENSFLTMTEAGSFAAVCKCFGENLIRILPRENRVSIFSHYRRYRSSAGSVDRLIRHVFVPNENIGLHLSS